MRKFLAAMLCAVCLVLIEGWGGAYANTPERTAFEASSVQRWIHYRKSHVRRFKRGRHFARYDRGGRWAQKYRGRHAARAYYRQHAAAAAVGSVTSAIGSYSSGLVSVARQYLGTNPTGQRSLWCMDFVNLVARQVGYRGTHSRAASSALSWPAAQHGCVGCVAVTTRGGRRRAGFFPAHVGIVSGYTAHGDPILISGNCGRYRTCEAPYPRSRIIGYRMPS
jgi:uncharacterized protein (TIGR02594 family)